MNNYFALFEIEPCFDIDVNELEKKYIDLSRRFHPDTRNGQASEIININKAYEVLKSSLKRAEYILNLFNIKIKLDDEILHESMEIREYLLECKDLQFIERTVGQKIRECIKNLTDAFAVKDFNSAAIQVLRLKYLYKSSEEVKKKNAANSNF